MSIRVHIDGRVCAAEEAKISVLDRTCDVGANSRQRDVQVTFPARRSARWNEEMDERSARRNHETGCQDGPSRSFA